METIFDFEILKNINLIILVAISAFLLYWIFFNLSYPSEHSKAFYLIGIEEDKISQLFKQQNFLQLSQKIYFDISEIAKIIQLAAIVNEKSKNCQVYLKQHSFSNISSNINSCQGIILVIPFQFNDYIEKISELLYSILIHKKYQYGQIPIQIALDCSNAQSSSNSLIQLESILEKDINELTSCEVEIQEDKQSLYNNYFKRNNIQFKFSDTTIQFCQISIQEQQIEKINQFLCKYS